MIYFDYNATTPLEPEVLEEMLPFFRDFFGNASSTHALGREVRVKMDEAREQVADLITCRPGEIIFTSGGTESDNFAISGVAWGLKEKGNHIITSQVEHPAVLNACKNLEKQGFKIDYVPVDTFGKVNEETIQDCITPKTTLISIQHANSEVGTLQPIEEISRIAQERGILFHTDAVQSVGKIPVDLSNGSIDLLSISSHKIYGPKGVGALYVKRGTPPLFPLISGGGQEKKRRGGTENIPGIVGLGKAASIAKKRVQQDSKRIRRLRDILKNKILSEIVGVDFWGASEDCLPNTLCLGFDEVDGQSLMIKLDLMGVAISTGTACSSGSALASEVLIAMGVTEKKIFNSIRISLGRHTTEDEVEKAFEYIKNIILEIREKKSISNLT